MKCFIWERWYETREIFALIMQKIFQFLSWRVVSDINQISHFRSLGAQLLPHRCSALSSLLADKKLPIISPCSWTSLRLQITCVKKKWAEGQQNSLAAWACCVEDAEDPGAGFGHRATPIPAVQLHPAVGGMGKPSALLCSRFYTGIPNIQLQINCTHDELGLSTLSVAITQGVSCYNFSDILVHSTVPMFFQH